MALKAREPVTTGLKFKVRGKSDKKKVMIYGNDGTGKSTFAETYCKQHNLKPIVIDVDDTNYTSLPIVEVDLSSDLKAYKFVKNIVNEVVQSGEFDTIILDGVTSYLEMLVSKANGLKKYSDRAERFQDVLRTLLSSGMHLIFIGQSDMKVIYNEEHQSNKMVIKINSLVNEKYHCYVDDKGRYKVETEKYRVVEDSEKE
jgi:adenosyl cobinamide kinase/adenosyl cobinamide phosphate guanylyltransferase